MALDFELPTAWTATPRRVLITGCAGFLGSHLSEALVVAGHDVLGIDVFSDYYDPMLKRENIAGVLEAPNFQLVEADLNDVDLEELARDREYVFHFAAQAGVRASWGSEFDIYLHSNIRATQRLLEALLKLQRSGSPFRRLIYSSSSSVYGNQPTYPVAETVDKRPFSPYGVSKLAAEQLCILYADNHGLPSSSLRYFTVYGPRQRPDMAFRKFLEAARRGDPWMIYGDGMQSRDFTYVADALRANLMAADDPSLCGIYNIGGGSRVVLKEALELLREAALRHGVAKEIRLEFVERSAGDVLHTGAVVDRALQEIGWKAQVSLADGLDAEAAWVGGRS